MSFITRIIFQFHRFKHLGKVKEIGNQVSVIHPEYISIGEGLILDHWCRFHTWPEYRGKRTGSIPELLIGNQVSFMRNCYVSCLSRIEIGDGCLFGDNVFITDNYHGDGSKEQKACIPLDRPLYSKGSVRIGKNVWVGRNVCIMPGVEIGDGVVIGANSVVTHSIDSGKTVAGIPARELRRDNVE